MELESGQATRTSGRARRPGRLDPSLDLAILDAALAVWPTWAMTG